MNLISVPVTLLLLKIASYMVDLLEEKIYLSSNISYRALSTWFSQYSKMATENENKSSHITNATVRNAETKIPTFKVLF